MWLNQYLNPRHTFRPVQRLSQCACAVGAIALPLLMAVLFVSPTQAAERIRFQYGLLGLSITRENLETFAETGSLECSVRSILSRLSPDAREQLRAVLQARYDVDPVMVNRFSYTRPGYQLLTEIGELIQTDSGQNGFYGLRAALTLAASDPNGLTILNFIEQFPTDIRIDVGQALAIADDLEDLFSETQQAINQLAEETQAIAAQEPAFEGQSLTDPRQPGAATPTVQTLLLQDEARDRTIAVDFYLPELEPDVQNPQQLPIIVISNGLGARRTRFDELAIHLTSHGFAVAMLDHPGSDRQRLLEFNQGLHSENFDATEFVDRPLDVSFLLDELMRLNRDTFGDRLDMSRVGIFGYSFGGTTALALAGAEPDFEHLAEDCATQSGLLNISLLYQCRALEVSRPWPNVRDERIQAVYVFVPFSRSLYGPEGMAQVRTPVFWEATEHDILTPLTIEQLPVFSWLAHPETDTEKETEANTDTEAGPPNDASESNGDRYLAVASGLPHARLTLDVLNRLNNEAIAWETIKPIAETYHQMLSLTFFQVHLAGHDAYRPFLQARGMQYLSEESHPIYWRSGQ
ncbi:MAG: alpha/beta hydrolase [Cyanobacteria bacterium J06627_8]